MALPVLLIRLVGPVLHLSLFFRRLSLAYAA